MPISVVTYLKCWSCLFLMHAIWGCRSSLFTSYTRTELLTWVLVRLLYASDKPNSLYTVDLVSAYCIKPSCLVPVTSNLLVFELLCILANSVFCKLQRYFSYMLGLLPLRQGVIYFSSWFDGEHFLNACILISLFLQDSLQLFSSSICSNESI